MPKMFTLEQANQLLPEVEERLSTIRERKSFYLRAHDAIFVQELARDAEKKAGRDMFESNLDSDIHELEDAIEVLAREIEALAGLGCVLRSIDKGLIDFPGSHRGERVYFAWQLGEKQIRYFRRIKASAETREALIES